MNRFIYDELKKWKQSETRKPLMLYGVYPIEVKAEENVKSKSLAACITHDFKDYNLHGIRFSMKGFKEQDWMTNIPLYAVRAFIIRS